MSSFDFSFRTWAWFTLNMKEAQLLSKSGPGVLSTLTRLSSSIVAMLFSVLMGLEMFLSHRALGPPTAGAKNSKEKTKAKKPT